MTSRLGNFPIRASPVAVFGELRGNGAMKLGAGLDGGRACANRVRRGVALARVDRGRDEVGGGIEGLSDSSE